MGEDMFNRKDDSGYGGRTDGLGKNGGQRYSQDGGIISYCAPVASKGPVMGR